MGAAGALQARKNVGQLLQTEWLQVAHQRGERRHHQRSRCEPPAQLQVACAGNQEERRVDVVAAVLQAQPEHKIRDRKGHHRGEQHLFLARRARAPLAAAEVHGPYDAVQHDKVCNLRDRAAQELRRSRDGAGGGAGRVLARVGGVVCHAPAGAEEPARAHKRVSTCHNTSVWFALMPLGAQRGKHGCAHAAEGTAECCDAEQRLCARQCQAAMNVLRNARRCTWILQELLGQRAHHTKRSTKNVTRRTGQRHAATSARYRPSTSAQVLTCLTIRLYGSALRAPSGWICERVLIACCGVCA